ncbi:hypothetical protein JTB14_027338 [Gonioctena quinquepunctata]|nr:hypothetical protein JTB14_027338 [Gonioctena quinquepunctata]
MSLKICVLFSISTAIAEMTPSPIVEIVQGKIKGSVWKDYDGKDFYSFLGIPYAKPPLGDLRFKPSVPADSWCGVRDATNEGNRCYSRHDRTGVMGGSEDCLNLNIYTRTLPHEDNRLKPVMVYIHGGGFVEGCNSPKSYGPEFLITEDIVLVVINYRIGIFGFLCLKDPSLDIPGNNGMKDQVLALKWRRRRICPLLDAVADGKGLFHRAILQSGSAFNYWAEGDWVASTIAKHLGVKVDSEKKALEVIKNATTEELGKAREKMQGEFKPANRRFFGVVVEYPNPTAFLTKPPMEIISSGEYNKVPMMAGFNSREGILLLGAGPLSEINPEDHIPWQMEIKKGSKTSEEICKKMKDYYLEGENKEDIFLLPTDSMFLAGITAMIQHHLTNLQKPLYMYRVSLEAELNLLRKCEFYITWCLSRR